jgi:cell wall-associated NlpC family hydrolase
MIAANLTDRSGVHRCPRARPIAGPLPLLIAGVCAAALSGCASARTLHSPAPFPGAASESPLVTPAATRPPDRLTTATDAAVRSALLLRGTRYQFGGSSPESGFDCSGLVAYVWAEQSITLPRSVASQFGVGIAVHWDRLQRGDLVFFSTLGPGATHVGIVTDASRTEFVHAPANGGSVRVERFDAPYWRGRFVGARRLL